MAVCKDCNAEIEWGVTERGKHMPLDVTRDGRGNQIETAGGNFVLVNGQIRFYGEADRKLARDRRTSHFSTCAERSR